MSSKHYYFVASLPILEFGLKPPVSYQSFTDDCERLLSSEDFDIIKEARLDLYKEPQGKNPVFDAWAEFSRSFRNEIVRLRLQKAGKGPFDYLRTEGLWIEPFLAGYVSQAAKSDDPLSAEKFLDQIRWQKLSELAIGHHFDLGFLIVYALKLQILERYKAIGSPKGKETFEEYKRFDASGELAYSQNNN